MPEYKKASYSGEELVLKNSSISIKVYKRLSGWGFAEIYNADNKLMGVIDNFGELKLRDQDIPMRIEADTVSKNGNELIFDVCTSNAAQRLKGTSFESWIGYPFTQTVLKGKYVISLEDERIKISTTLYSDFNVYAEYLRLLWLYCGESSYGVEKTDALLPGVDWPVGDEWSS